MSVTIVPPSAAGAAIPVPTATAKATDTHTGFALLEQPISIATASPVLADGTPLAAPDVGGKLAINSAVAVETFSYGALLYRINAAGVVDIFDGTVFSHESTFDFAYDKLKPTELVFDAKSGQWNGTFVLSTVATLDPSFVATDTGTHRPLYGFLTVLRLPRKPQSTISASRSALGVPFGIIATSDALRAKIAPVQATTPVQDPAKADGFEIIAKDSSLVPVATAIVSSNGAVPAGVTLQALQSGVVQASVTLEPNGVVTITSAVQVTINAPLVQINGALHAESYV